MPPRGKAKEATDQEVEREKLAVVGVAGKLQRHPGGGGFVEVGRVVQHHCGQASLVSRRGEELGQGPTPMPEDPPLEVDAPHQEQAVSQRHRLVFQDPHMTLAEIRPGVVDARVELVVPQHGKNAQGGRDPPELLRQLRFSGLADVTVQNVAHQEHRVGARGHDEVHDAAQMAVVHHGAGVEVGDHREAQRGGGRRGGKPGEGDGHIVLPEPSGVEIAPGDHQRHQEPPPGPEAPPSEKGHLRQGEHPGKHVVQVDEARCHGGGEQHGHDVEPQIQQEEGPRRR